MTERTQNRARQVAGQILEIVRSDGLGPGDRLLEDRFARRLGVSRGPIRSGLNELATLGMASKVANRGYVLTASPQDESALAVLKASEEGEQDYLRLADDRLEGRLPDVVSEKELMRRYAMRRPDLLRLLNRISMEGWIERLPGYGWRFTEIVSNPNMYGQTTRFRLLIEPAGILEPEFRFDPSEAARVYEQQERVLNGGYATFTKAEIFRFGCELHETIAKMSGSPFLLDSLRRINSMRRLFSYRSIIPDETSIVRQATEHLKLIDLLRADRRREAASFMVLHLHDTLVD